MEEDAKFVKSSFLKRSTIQKQLEYLKDRVDEAEEIIQFEQAHNPEILYAIDLIERFLREKKRICYGGTAINAILPKKLQFYDYEKDIPDYDFFTPDPEADIKDLVLELKKEGFSDVVQRMGIHKGTYKILVNFVAVADITELDSQIYSIIYKRSIVKGGIHYCDPDFLRMMMYLELSRPRGQVERWEKVFERLVLLNTAFPPKACKKSLLDITGKAHIPLVIREIFLNFVLERNRILVGAEVIALYNWILDKRYKKKPSVQWFLHKSGTLVFLSPEAIRDGIYLQEKLGKESIVMETLRGKEELLPERVVLTYKNIPLAMIVQETACHSYNEIPLQENRTLHVGTLETLLTLYYSLELFGEDTENKKYLQYSLHCLTQKLVEMGTAFYKLGVDSPLPIFSIQCSGYQKGYATLLREKFVRVKQQKKKNSTVKRNTTQRSKTRRSLLAE